MQDPHSPVRERETERHAERESRVHYQEFVISMLERWRREIPVVRLVSPRLVRDPVCTMPEEEDSRLSSDLHTHRHIPAHTHKHAFNLHSYMQGYRNTSRLTSENLHSLSQKKVSPALGLKRCQEGTMITNHTWLNLLSVHCSVLPFRAFLGTTKRVGILVLLTITAVMQLYLVNQANCSSRFMKLHSTLCLTFCSCCCGKRPR